MLRNNIVIYSESRDQVGESLVKWEVCSGEKRKAGGKVKMQGPQVVKVEGV